MALLVIRLWSLIEIVIIENSIGGALHIRELMAADRPEQAKDAQAPKGERNNDQIYKIFHNTLPHLPIVVPRTQDSL